jgi:hypothetical protein
MKEFEYILKAKREYYGNTEAAIEFAAEEYARQFGSQLGPLVSLRGAETTICEFEVKDDVVVKAIIFLREDGRYEVKAIKGTTQGELESMVAQLWQSLEPPEN